MASRARWMSSWAEAGRLFASHDALPYATLAAAFATESEPGLPEAPLVVLAALRRAALQGRATDPFTGDVDAVRSDARRLSEEIDAASESGLIQYTDPLRLGDILPGMWLTAQWYPGRPLRIVDLGASAGMLLLANSITVRFNREAWTPEGSLGAVDYPMDVPDELMRTPLDIESAVGIDLRPLDMRDPDHVELLRSFAWPGPTIREERLQMAIRVAQQRPPTLVRGDVLDVAPDLVRERLDRDAVTVVIDSAFSHYLPMRAAVQLGRSLDSLAGMGPLVMIARGPGESDSPGRSCVRVIDMTGRRRKIYAETNVISESPLWLDRSTEA